jgi:hypothetical protein
MIHGVTKPSIKQTLKRLTGFSTPFFGISWNPGDQSFRLEGLRERLQLLGGIIAEYSKIESSVWQAREHFREGSLSKDDAVEYLRPTTTAARDLRANIRARRFELGNLAGFLDSLSVEFLLSFAQLLAQRNLDASQAEALGVPTLADTLGNIREKREALSAALSVYQRALDVGEASLSSEDRELLLWLCGMQRGDDDPTS